ncbi:MAG: YggS family pyridoxal phosphate-dependent enzyme [Bradymonadaceae bacterium]|nr:YggS family pyridoxal phosphate-dependent enzyme [Lujinxingiaceae bacterium]
MTGYDPQRLHEALLRVRRTISEACERAGRAPGEVRLVAVSKTHPVEAIAILYELGVRDFGESYVQELVDKVGRLPNDIRWHFIGGLQSNKARFLGNEISLLHSVDRTSLIEALQRRSEQPMDILLQVNVAAEATKGGTSPDQLVALYDCARSQSKLTVRGLMTMAPYCDDPESSRGHFRVLRALLDELRTHAGEGVASALSELSMGMSDDFAVAIEEGATLVRVGTALFGDRQSD